MATARTQAGLSYGRGGARQQTLPTLFKAGPPKSVPVSGVVAVTGGKVAISSSRKDDTASALFDQLIAEKQLTVSTTPTCSPQKSLPSRGDSRNKTTRYSMDPLDPFGCLEEDMDQDQNSGDILRSPNSSVCSRSPRRPVVAAGLEEEDDSCSSEEEELGLDRGSSQDSITATVGQCSLSSPQRPDRGAATEVQISTPPKVALKPLEVEACTTGIRVSASSCRPCTALNPMEVEMSGDFDASCRPESSASIDPIGLLGVKPMNAMLEEPKAPTEKQCEEKSRKFFKSKAGPSRFLLQKERRETSPEVVTSSLESKSSFDEILASSLMKRTVSDTTENMRKKVETAKPIASTGNAGCEGASSSLNATDENKPGDMKIVDVERKKIFHSPNKVTSRAVYKHSWHHGADDNNVKDQESGSFSCLRSSGTTTSTSTTLCLGYTRSRPTCSDTSTSTVIASRAPSIAVTRHTRPAKRYGEDAVTSLRCEKQAKKLFTVVRNVKQAHQCREYGEAQDLNDEIRYLLGCLTATNPINIRRIGALRLANHCLSPSFRAHLRAHNFVAKIFGILPDAHSDPILSLSTACVFYLLSRDRLGIVSDRRILTLVVNLAKCENPSFDHEELKQHWDKVWALLLEWKNRVESSSGGQSIQFHITRENLSVSLLDEASFLAVEALVFVSIQNPSPWFKRELRDVGGLDYAVHKLNTSADSLNLEEADAVKMVETINMVQLYLRIIENATAMDKENQRYLVGLDDSQAVRSCVRVLNYCQTVLAREASNCPSPTMSLSPPSLRPSEPSARPTPSTDGGGTGSTSEARSDKQDCNPLQKALHDCLSCLLKALCNLSHENDLCCFTLGKDDVFLRSLLNCIVCHQNCIDPAKQFDTLVLALGLMINLVEHCNANRRFIIGLTIPWYSSERSRTEQLPSLAVLTMRFNTHDKAARELENSLDLEEMASNSQSGGNGQNAESHSNAANEPTPQEIREMVAAALKNAGKHMEDSMAASYIALLIGCLLQQNESHGKEVKSLLSGNTFEPMLTMLSKFLEFMEKTSSFGNTGAKSIERVIETLERLD